MPAFGAKARALLIDINANHPEPRKIRRAVDALLDGGVIAYPTDTAYGLGCDLINKRAVDRLYEIKGIDRSQNLSFICPDLGDIARYAIVENRHYRILRRYLPGPYTFILEATRDVPKMVQSKRKTVGIRVPALPLVRALARELGHPILTTTADLRGNRHHEGDSEDPLIDAREIDDTFQGLALTIDGGTGGLVGTTVIDLTHNPAVVIREGAGVVGEFL